MFERIISEEKGTEQMRILIVGGVAGGASVAARARRLDARSELSCLREVIMCLFQLCSPLLPQRHGKEQRCPGHDESGEV